MKKLLIYIVLGVVCVLNYSNDTAAATFKDCGISDISKAEIINCSNTDIDDFSLLKDAKNLKRLTLKSANLNEFPAEITSLTKLTHVDLSNNNIRKLPNDLNKLTNLKVLALNNNRIDSLDSSLWKTTSLTDLYLNTNSIYYIPSDINKLTSLEVFEARDNSINSVASLNSLSKLKILKLENNLIINMGSISRTNINDLGLDNNILSQKSINSATKNFKIANQNKVVLSANRQELKTEYFVNNEANAIINSIKLQNNKRPVGFKKYELSMKNEKGKVIKISDYIDKNNKVIKNGTVYSNIKLTANNSSTYILKDTLVIKFVMSNKDNNKEDDKGSNKDDGKTKSNSNSRTQTSNSVQEDGLVVLEKLKESEGKETVSDKLKDFFNNSSNAMSDSDSGERIQYYIITVALIIIIFIPLLLLLLLIRRTYKNLEDV